MCFPTSEPCSDNGMAGPAPQRPVRAIFGGLHRRGIWATLFAVVLVPLVTGLNPSPSAAQGHGPGYSIESFQVGENVYVRSLAIDRANGSLWVGTSVGAMEIDLKSQNMKQVFTRKDGLANEYVFSIGVGPAGKIWFGTNAGGASTYAYKERAWKTYFPMHGLADYWVYCFAFAKDGGVWIGTWDGVSRFEPASGEFTTFRDELINIWVYGIDIDPDGRIWFGTEGGVSMFDGREWRSWTHEDGLGAPNMMSLPPSPNTGLGTKSRHDLSVLVGTGESYNPNYVFAALTDQAAGGIWFGTWGAGVSHFDGKETWTSYNMSDGLAGNIVYSIAQQADGILWFGTNRGLTRYDGKNWRTFRAGLPAPDIYAIAIEDSGIVWLGVRGAVIRLAPVK